MTLGEARLVEELKARALEELSGKDVNQVTTGDFSSQVRRTKSNEQAIRDIEEALYCLNPEMYDPPRNDNRTRIVFASTYTGAADTSTS